MGLQGDVSNLDRVYETVKQQKGGTDVLFANAGIGIKVAPLGSVTEEQFDKTFGINVKGLFTVQKALPLFQDGGSIILTALVADSKGFLGASIYAATKAAIRSFARSWTVDLKNRKIRVNALSPGRISTPLLSEQFATNTLNTVPMRRVDIPEEVAKAVALLASDDSSYITGIELFVDGGLAQI
jgi:NAD(P)-dependent dehydrogenase (short-subunit alcohol dehydrogenase family)